ncbi:hypothetical protein AZE41_17725 [Sporosarcina psychrophila]|nr:hypothetical protein AZE41_17725 [Sporosarcina psychrophila]
MDSKVVIHSFPKALALRVPVSLVSDGRTPTIRLTKKLRRNATKSHPYAARNPDNSIVVVQSKAIRKHLYIGGLVFYHKSKQSITGQLWLINTCDVEQMNTYIN